MKKGTPKNLLARALRKVANIIERPERINDISDEYITWLCFANAGILNRGNLYSFDYAISHLPSSAPIFEIGSFCGLSTNAISHFKRNHGVKNRLITCDKWEFENSGDPVFLAGSPILHSEYKQFVRDTYIRNIKMFSGDDLPFTIEFSSDEFFSAWKKGIQTTDVLGQALKLGGPLSFCYIDGNHTYEFAKNDFLNCDSVLEVNGFLLFDDSRYDHFGVKRLMPEVLETGRYKLIALNPNHLFQKLKAL